MYQQMFPKTASFGRPDVLLWLKTSLCQKLRHCFLLKFSHHIVGRYTEVKGTVHELIPVVISKIGLDRLNQVGGTEPVYPGERKRIREDWGRLRADLSKYGGMETNVAFFTILSKANLELCPLYARVKRKAFKHLD